MRRLVQILLAGMVVAALASAAMAAPVAAGGPTTRFVDDDGLAGRNGCGGDREVLDSVDQAVDEAHRGDTILVCPGTYVDDLFVVVDDLTIRGVKPWKATIIPGVDDDVAVIDIDDDTTGVTIQWLEILAPTDAPCNKMENIIDIDAGANRTTIRANHMGALGTDTLGECGYESGIEVDDSRNVVLAWNRIVDFQEVGIIGEDVPDIDVHGNSMRYLHETVDDQSGPEAIGIYLIGADDANVSRNVVRSLPLLTGPETPLLFGGIGIEGGTGPVVRDNRVFNAEIGMGIFADDVRARGNRIRKVVIGAEIGGTSGMRYTENIVHAIIGGIVVEDSSDNVFRRNDARGQVVVDCVDESDGDGTLGTDNTWEDNIGRTGSDDPDGICPLPPPGASASGRSPGDGPALSSLPADLRRMVRSGEWPTWRR